MASGENWATAAGDWLTGNTNGPKLRAAARAEELANAKRQEVLAKQALEQAQKQVAALTPIQERRLLDEQSIKQQLAQLGPDRAKADLDLAVRTQTDALDATRARNEASIDKDKTNNLYANLRDLIALQQGGEAAARDAYLGQNTATQNWISNERQAAQDFTKSMIPGLGERLLESAVSLAPLFALSAIS